MVWEKRQMSFRQLKIIIEAIIVWCGILSPIVFIITAVSDLFSIFEKSTPIFSFFLFFSACFVLVYAVYYAITIKKISLQKKKLEKLEKEICKGNKYLLNEAMIEMDIEREKYIIEIKKEYEIISDSIKWFECQFYANIDPTDANKAKKHYDEDPITWDELNAQAYLQYKNTDEGDTEYNDPIEVYVKLVAEGNNYKQFHIEYLSTNNQRLNIKKGSQILLNYRYEIPVKKWGNYLNRYVTYWGEKMKISIACKDQQKLRQNDLVLYKTNNEGAPVLYQKVTWTEKFIPGKKLHIRELLFDANSLCKYVITWDANVFFNIKNVDLNTKIGIDELQLTQY
jgi:hypothetical protein